MLKNIFKSVIRAFIISLLLTIAFYIIASFKNEAMLGKDQLQFFIRWGEIAFLFISLALIGIVEKEKGGKYNNNN